jgi:transposase
VRGHQGGVHIHQQQPFHVSQDRIDRGEAEGLTTEERARLRQLEAENAKLRMERDLLKRTVAFWVKETSTP